MPVLPFLVKHSLSTDRLPRCSPRHTCAAVLLRVDRGVRASAAGSAHRSGIATRQGYARCVPHCGPPTAGSAAADRTAAGAVSALLAASGAAGLVLSAFGWLDGPTRS